ncbi:amidohydrolase family protein, partial [Chromatiaceae bacterium AAb-1]|nr:amidohydrolase family protein [Chromatiaceae bacterium AAb-1]
VGFTHLYNAMSALGSRAPGMVGVALADPDSWCGIILDGYHVHPVAAKVALAAKPEGKLLLVTDAMSPVGTQETAFRFAEGKVIRQGDKLVSEEGKLAGSVLDMASAVRYAVSQLGVSPAQALRMASLYPAQCLGVPLGRLAVGALADMVLLDSHYQVCASWIKGNTAGF